MIRYAFVIGLALLSAGMPLFPHQVAPIPPARPWPVVFEGRRLTPVAPGLGDTMLARDFPGHVARFSDGRRQIVLRQVSRATRQLHAPRICFAAMGYEIKPEPMAAVKGGYASCFAARNERGTLKVCEHISDAQDRVFSDVAGWYWPALLGTSKGPWLAAMTVERTH